MTPEVERPVLYVLEFWNPATNRWALGGETYYPRSVAERKAKRSGTKKDPVRVVPLYRSAAAPRPSAPTMVEESLIHAAIRIADAADGYKRAERWPMFKKAAEAVKAKREGRR